MNAQVDTRYIYTTTTIPVNGNESPGAQRRVLYAPGWFENNVTLEDSTLQYLVGLVSDKRRGDMWTPLSLKNYLSYTWVRLLEETKVLVCRAQNGTPIRTDVDRAGVSEFFLLWNSGLVDKQNQPILFICVQRRRGTVPAYILLRSGIFCGRYPDYLVNDPMSRGLILAQDSFIMGPMGRGGNGPTGPIFPLPARYVAPRDPSLLFDDEADFDLSVGHLMENAARFIDARVVDEAEFVVGHTNVPIDTMEYPNVFWSQDERFRLADGRAVAVIANPANNTVAPYFRRHQQGKNSFTHLLQRWVREAVEFCRRTRSLVVPQFYYRRFNCEVPNQYCYRGDLQLLLPLYCEEDGVRLALTMEYVPNPNVPGGYWYAARTVLTKDWARSNARLLSCPQVHWINPDA